MPTAEAAAPEPVAPATSDPWQSDKTEIASLMIIMKLDQYKYAEATAIAVVMLVASFAILLAINALQWWIGRGRLKGI